MTTVAAVPEAPVFPFSLSSLLGSPTPLCNSVALRSTLKAFFFLCFSAVVHVRPPGIFSSFRKIGPITPIKLVQWKICPITYPLENLSNEIWSIVKLVQQSNYVNVIVYVMHFEQNSEMVVQSLNVN